MQKGGATCTASGAASDGGALLAWNEAKKRFKLAVVMGPAYQQRLRIGKLKVKLIEARYQGMRRVKGDGNCFYRSLLMGWMERLLTLPMNERSLVWTRLIPEVSADLANQMADQARRKELLLLAAAFAKRTRLLCENGATEDQLLAAARKSEETGESLRWLRLVTAGYLRQQSERFEPSVVLEDGTSFEVFCEAEVERMGVEADEPQVQALSSALGLRLRVEYLDSSAMPWSNRSGMHRHVVCGPPTSGVVSGACPHFGRRPTLAACLLFRPGHYDLLAPKDWADTEEWLQVVGGLLQEGGHLAVSQA